MLAMVCKAHVHPSSALASSYWLSLPPALRPRLSLAEASMTRTSPHTFLALSFTSACPLSNKEGRDCHA